jgi:SAM-dependent methyltransferase
LYVNPRPSNDEILTSQQLGEHHGIKVTGTFGAFKVRMYLNVLRDLYGDGSALRNKRWLDIGCGHGEFLMALNEFSEGTVTARGVEPNVDKIKSAQKRSLDVSYFDLDGHAETYDFVSLLNVYSHLPDPSQSLGAWKRLLEPEGELLLWTGDTANLSCRDHFQPFNLPDHLSFASEAIVVNLLDRIGYDVIDVRKYPAIRGDIKSICKEIVKVVWPGKHSKIRYLTKHRTTNMYIRSKLRTES